MLTKSQLIACKNIKIERCDKNALTDLRDVTVDKDKGVADRIEEFAGKVKNPYLFKVGDITVKAEYSGERDFSTALCDAFFTMETFTKG